MNRIGKYEVIAPLGHGGSGSVFRAYDPVMARPVAIKLLNDSIDSKELPKLRSEARAAGRLHHRNIVSIFDLAEEEGKPYLVMELLEGADLSNSLPPDTPMGIRQSVEIMHQVAQGLLHAHTHGVVHRDVSPQNIWLVPDGTVKLIDFGLAGGFQGGRTLTNTDSPLGTVLFFSPEHLGNSPVELDPRSDIFSYGSVFYQLLAGRNPFAGLDDQETMCNIQLHDPEALVDVRPECPVLLSLIVHRALLKDLDLRYQSFQDVLTDLDLVLMQLRRAEADELFATVQRDVAEDRVEQAKVALSRILELVPDRQEARELLERLKDQQRQSAVRAKVQAYLVEAEKQTQERRFRAAILALEKAQRLDPDSSEISTRLEAARSAQERHEKCTVLVKQSGEHRRGGRLEEALAAAAEAAELDPGQADTQRLVETLRIEVATDRERRLSEGLAHARRLLAEEQFVAADAVLSSLAERFADAPGVQPLLSYTRGELTLRNRRHVIQNARKEAIRRAAFGEYQLAIEALDRALDIYPDDPELTLLRVATQASLFEGAKGIAPAGNSRVGDPNRRICVCGKPFGSQANFCDGCGRQYADRQ